MKTPTVVLLLALASPLSFAAPPPPADLDAVKQAPANPDKQSSLALDLAEQSVKKARTLVKEAGTREALSQQLKATGDATEFSLKVLRDTGKPAKKMSGPFKKGEIRTRELLRQLEDLSNSISIDDREPVHQATARVEAVHDDFLKGIMSGK